MTTEQSFLESLHAFLEGGDVNSIEPEPWEGAPVKSVRTFEEAMILTHNRGLVVNLIDGTQFQVTIVQSR
jgi:hypothetical protein